MSGPGNFAIDEKGFVWVNDNYQLQPADQFACEGLRTSLERTPPIPGRSDTLSMRIQGPYSAEP